MKSLLAVLLVWSGFSHAAASDSFMHGYEVSRPCHPRDWYRLTQIFNQAGKEAHVFDYSGRVVPISSLEYPTVKTAIEQNKKTKCSVLKSTTDDRAVGERKFQYLLETPDTQFMLWAAVDSKTVDSKTLVVNDLFISVKGTKPPR